MTTPGPERRSRPGERADACRYAWRDLDAADAAALWVELGGWVGWVRERYQLGSRIPGCWYRHESVVEELTALMASHTAAYRPGPDSRDIPREDLVAWHLQWLWPVVEQLTRISDFSGCGPSRCGYRATTQPLFAGFEDFVTADLETRLTPTPADDTRAAIDTGATTDTADVERDANGIDVIDARRMRQLLDTEAATAVTDGERITGIRYDRREWVFSRIDAGWIPRRNQRRP